MNRRLSLLRSSTLILSIKLLTTAKTWFFTFLCFLNWARQNSDLANYTSKIQVFCRPECTKGGRLKMNFGNYQIEKWVSQTVSRWKNWVICLIFPSWVMVLNLPKIVYFLQICADLSKKPKYIKAIYFYLSGGPHHAFSKNSIFL